MPDLETRIFIGTDADDATAQLASALADGSFGIATSQAMWITHRTVTPGAMQPSSYELHVTAWVNGSRTLASREAQDDEQR